MFFSWNCRCISDCFSSSRLKIMTFRGVNRPRTVSVNFRPNDPVPPVIRTTLLFRSIVALVSDHALGLNPEPRPGHLEFRSKRPGDRRRPQLVEYLGIG